MISAPFFFSCDIDAIDEFTVRLLADVVAVNQDELGQWRDYAAAHVKQYRQPLLYNRVGIHGFRLTTDYIRNILTTSVVISVVKSRDER